MFLKDCWNAITVDDWLRRVFFSMLWCGSPIEVALRGFGDRKRADFECFEKRFAAGEALHCLGIRVAWNPCCSVFVFFLESRCLFYHVSVNEL